ncbi:MAG: RNA polymerase sigma factor [Candidatus Aminicenantes bacterium]|nr:MAG: RNA polymerase sigma factor [Candidatus Aminicenantes bacterium]
MKTDETKLVDRLCQGDLEAFQELVERYKKKVYYLAYDMAGDHHEAEDISQEVFIKVFRHIKKFRKDAALKSWIYQITVNTCIDVQRKKSRKPHVLMESSQMDSLQQASSWTGSTNTNPERLAEANMIQHRIQQLLHKVSPKERSAFVMRYYNELKTTEIAIILNLSTNTIKSLLFRARKKLQKELSFYQSNLQTEVSNESM